MVASITMIGIGKEKDSICDEIKRYQKMMRPYAAFSTIFLKPAGTASSVDYVLEAEMKRIEKKLPADCILVALGEEGKLLSSAGFADWIAKTVSAPQELVFVIGGAYGLSPALKKRARQIISLSSMTFPHRLCWLLLAEQVYRAFTILHGHPYHKQ